MFVHGFAGALATTKRGVGTVERAWVSEVGQSEVMSGGSAARCEVRRWQANAGSQLAALVNLVFFGGVVVHVGGVIGVGGRVVLWHM